MHNKMPNKSRMDISQLKNEKIRESYSGKRAKDIETIEPTKYLKAHANRIGAAITKRSRGHYTYQ